MGAIVTEYVSGYYDDGSRHKAGQFGQWRCRLTDAFGNTMISVRAGRCVEFQTYRNEWGEKSNAIGILLPHNRGWIVGYTLGNGMLFRGEYRSDIRHDDTQDAKIVAEGIAEYWIGIDADDEAKFQEELRQEQEAEQLKEWEGMMR
jgi:hypothetical protein